jgi:hypothetical protein
MLPNRWRRNDLRKSSGGANHDLIRLHRNRFQLRHPLETDEYAGCQWVFAAPDQQIRAACQQAVIAPLGG